MKSSSNSHKSFYFASLLFILVLTAFVLDLLVSHAAKASPPDSAQDLKAVVYLPMIFGLSETPIPKTPTPAPAGTPTLATASDWPQVQKDPQHTGFTSEILGTNIQVKWTHPFQPERVWPQVQAIVANGQVYVGTEMGHLYAIAASSGATVWQYPSTGNIGPIIASVAVDSGKVFFGSMDGAVYALNANTGALDWKQQLSSTLGFSTAPVIGDGKVMLGGRDGNFYAFSPDDGHVVWQYSVNAPILMTAAYDNGHVFFGSMDMYVYALNTSPANPADPSTIIAWKSPKISGMAFKDYWPVIYGGYVIVMPLPRIAEDGIRPGFPFGWYSGVIIPGGGMTDYQWLSKYGPTIAAGNATQVADFMNAQNAVMSDYQAHPQNYTLMINILDENTGRTTVGIPHFDTQALTGAKQPPCIDRDRKLIVPVMFVQSGWGRVDLASQRYSDILYDGTDRNGGPYTDGYPAGFGNEDENMNVSCAGNLILSFHYQEGSANYTGVFNLDTRKWTPISHGWRNGQMFTNTQSGGGNPPTVSNGTIYHISVYELIARTTQ